MGNQLNTSGVKEATWLDTSYFSADAMTPHIPSPQQDQKCKTDFSKKKTNYMDLGTFFILIHVPLQMRVSRCSK